METIDQDECAELDTSNSICGGTDTQVSTMMMRAGTRVPQPPPLSPSPTTPATKPPFQRAEDLHSREKTPHRGSARDQLRGKVVELARRKEEEDRKWPDDVTTGSGTATQTHAYHVPQGGGKEAGRPRKEVTFLLEDGKDDFPRNDLKSASRRQRAGHDSWEHITTMDLTDTAMFLDPHTRGLVNAPHQPPVYAHTQARLPQTTPDAPPLPRSARLRSLQGQQESPEKPRRNHHHDHHHHHEEHLHNNDRILASRVGLYHHAQPSGSPNNAATHATRTEAGTTKPVPRTLRAPSRIVLDHQPQAHDRHPPSRQDQASPKHGDRDSHKSKSTPSSPRSSGRSRDSTKGVSTKDKCQGQQETRASPTRQGHGFDYQRAARILNHAAHDPSARHHNNPHPPPHRPTPQPPSKGLPESQKRLRVVYVGQDRRAAGPRLKNLKGRSDERPSHYQSSGSSGGDSPRTSGDKSGGAGAGEMEVEVRGSALHANQQRLHTPVSSRRLDNRNPSNFASSLEMFKRRLKMNQTRLSSKENVEETEDDYVIRLLDTVPSTPASGNGKPQSGTANQIFGSHASVVVVGQEDTTYGHNAKQYSSVKGVSHPIPHPPNPRQHNDHPAYRVPRPPEEKAVSNKPLTPHPAKVAAIRNPRPTAGPSSKDDVGGQQQDKWTMAGDWEKQSGEVLGERSAGDGQEEETGGKATGKVQKKEEKKKEEKKKEENKKEQKKQEVLDDLDVNSSASNTKGPDSGDDFYYVHVAEPPRTPLPQVRTYVVEGVSDASRRLPGHSHGLDSTAARPLALTQHNISMHNSFLQRRQEREKARQRRAELEKKAGLHVEGGGGGWLGFQEADVRMQRWLVDIDQHGQQFKDFQPMATGIKLAVMPTA